MVKEMAKLIPVETVHVTWENKILACMMMKTEFNNQYL